jgi:hypothetical protein
MGSLLKGLEFFSYFNCLRRIVIINMYGTFLRKV